EPVGGAAAGAAGPVGAACAGAWAGPGPGACGAAAGALAASSWIRLFGARPAPDDIRASVSEVRKNAPPRIMVARVMKSVAPRPPSTVWAVPPKAPPARPPPLPD